MKYTLILLTALLLAPLAAVHAAEPMAAPDLMPVKMLAPAKHAPVQIVLDGKARAVIFVADPKYREAPDPNPKKARLAKPSAVKAIVNELVETVRLTSGATLEVVTNPLAAGQPAIVIGDCDETRKAGIDAAKIPVEGFVVKTAANRVYLVGSTEALPAGSDPYSFWANDGTAWAVADFLERFVSVRWYWPLAAGGRCVVKSRSLAVPPIHYTDAPVFRMRLFHPENQYKAPWKSTWFDPEKQPLLPLPEGTKTLATKPLLTFLRSGNSWPYLIKSHEPQQLWKRDGGKWAAEHKEMFELKGDGTRNYSMLCYSAPETLKFILDGCEAMWDSKKIGGAAWVTSTCVTVSPGDMTVKCSCPSCRAKLAEGRAAKVDASLLMVEFVAKVAKEVKTRWPDKKVIYLPYWNYSKCPPKLKLPDNVTVMHANVGQGMAAMRDESIHGHAQGQIRGWSAATGGKITTWEYSNQPVGWTHAPMQFPNVVQNHYRKLRDVLVGSFINGQDVNEWSKTAPSLYVWMRVLWNPDINVEATFDEMCARMFGRGAKPARELMRLMADRWEKAEWHSGLGAAGRLSDGLFRDIWPPEVVAKMAALRDQARLETKDDPEARARLDYWLWTIDAFVAEANNRKGKK